MKRTVQALLFASLLLAGCANSPAGSDPVERSTARSLTATEISKVNENLTGICKAIVHYGLDPDRQIRRHVASQVEPLVRAVSAGSREGPTIQRRVRSTIRKLVARYRQCEPTMLAQIKGGLG